MSHHVTEELADFIENLDFSDCPAEVIAAAKLSLLDFIGVAMAGSRAAPLNRILMDTTVRFDSSTDCTILGHRSKASAVHAALINAVSGHSLDLDDGHRQALGHPGVCVVPAVLALGESIGAGGEQVLAAIVAGYETFIRIGKSMNPAIFERGFHTTGVCGTVAGAAAAAKILGCNLDQISNALGIAAIQSAGLLAVVHSGQMMKPLNAGKAAYSGVLSALLAREGAHGPKQILEGKDGFGQAMAGQWKPSLLTSGLGQRFTIMECYRKLYPACRHSHAAIDAALEIRNTNRIAIDEIRQINVTTYPAALKLTQKDHMPVDVPGTRFNLAFAVSLALVKGRAGLTEFSMESINDPKIRQLFERVQIFSDPYFESKKDNIRGAQVEVLVTGNKPFKKRFFLPKGEPENPATNEELIEKFRSCTGDYWSEPQKDDIIHAIEGMEQIKDFRLFTEQHL